MKLIVGLGNPGTQYEKTKHNAGFMAIDFFVEKNNLGNFTENKKLKAYILKTGDSVIIKPLTFMNISGEAVNVVKQYYKIENKDIIVVYDDLDIELGKIKSGLFESSAGHNGIKSIIDILGSTEFFRIRIGIKNDNPLDLPSEDIVLQKFSDIEKEKLDSAINEVNKILEYTLE